jgi:hypothetical protein
MGLAATGGGVKSYTHYKFTGLTNGSFASTLAITAVTSTSKTRLILNGNIAEGQAASGTIMLHLASTTGVEYALNITDAGAKVVAFTVEQRY